MSLYYRLLGSPEIKAAADENTLIVIPVGQVEEHEPHLPVETDCIIASAAAAEAIQGEIPVLVLPTVWTAYSVQQVARWPGLITFREPEPMITLMYWR
jgi:creatinine amidohydrolase